MKYVQPYGISDPEGPYINGDPSIGRQGSIPPAAAFEHPMREIVGVIDKSNFTPTDGDLLQLAKSVRSQGLNFADDTGAINSLTVSYDPPLTSYTVGLLLRVRVRSSNTGASTIDAGAGRVHIRRPNGTAMVAGDLSAGGLIDLAYDGTAFQMINYLGTGTGTGGDVNNYYIKIPYCVDTSVTPNIITAPFTPAITTLAAGDCLLVKVANTNTAKTTIAVNALAPITIKTVGSEELMPHDILAGSVFLLVYDGTIFQVFPNSTINSDVIINVPTTQWPTPASVFEGLKRKLISPLATVTVKLGIGIFAPFQIYHANTERIKIQGTMLAAPPTMSNFAQSGPSGAQRSADASTNLVMLRSRYGTEVQIPVGSGQIGIKVGTGSMPVVQDLFITSLSFGQNTGIGMNECTCINVATWGCYSGFYVNAAGTMLTSTCWASACSYGFIALHGGVINVNGGGAFGCTYNGISSQANSHCVAGTFYSRCNGDYGFQAANLSDMTLSNCDGINNTLDIVAMQMSLIQVYVFAATSYSPAFNNFGNNNSLITGVT